jgi:hypothetical protein
MLLAHPEDIKDHNEVSSHTLPVGGSCLPYGNTQSVKNHSLNLVKQIEKPYTEGYLSWNEISETYDCEEYGKLCPV